MNSGKLTTEQLKEIINMGKIKRKEVKVRAAIGEDCSIISMGSEECIISTDPITGSASNIGKLAVNINCNDIASCGVEPLGILVTILAPETSNMDDIKQVMQDISFECEKLNVEILGGHTEVTAAVNKIVVSCTVIGKCEENKSVLSRGAFLGDDILVTKDLCLEGTCILVSDKEEEVKEFLTIEEINLAKSYINNISVVKEGVISGKFGVNSMHDITEGGVLGALCEIVDISNCGFEINEDKLPITNITEKVCKYFNINPLRLISSGSMLITCKDGKELSKVLEKNGIKASIIGKITNDDKILIHKNGKREQVSIITRDELFNVK